MNIASLKDRIGQELGISDWLLVSQERINAFADATDDHQWIHVNPVRAHAESPSGTTIAHGFLTLSLIPTLSRQVLKFEGVRMSINYGLNRVRFVTPLPAGGRIRGRFSVVAVEDVGGVIQATWSVVVEREGGDKPCAVAELITRYHL